MTTTTPTPGNAPGFPSKFAMKVRDVEDRLHQAKILMLAAMNATEVEAENPNFAAVAAVIDAATTAVEWASAELTAMRKEG